MKDTSFKSNPIKQKNKIATEIKPTVFFPNLDGLRFFCFLSVFLFHSFDTSYESVKESGLYIFFKKFLAENGILGVNFFFVLSGFLITYLLLTEQNKFGKIKIGNFYIRRILRIWPLFYFCVFFGFVIFPLIKTFFGETSSESATPVYYIFFVNNLEFIKRMPDASNLGVLWSVAIEEQFYLVWPVLLTIVPRKYYLYLFSIIIAASYFFRLYYFNNPVVIEYHSIPCFSDLTIGGFFATLVFTNDKFKRIIYSAPKLTWYFLYAVLLTVFLFRKEIFHHGAALIAADRLLVSLLFIAVILEQCFAKNSVYKMSKFKLVSKLGTYTYGLYCLHMIGILIAAKGLAYLGMNKNVYQVIFLEGFLSLGITIGIALLSYHLYEKRFLRLKEKFARITKN